MAPRKEHQPPQRNPPELRNRTIATVANPTTKINKAFNAVVYDEACVLGKLDETIYVFYADGRVEPFEVEMAPFTTLLGQTDLATTQHLLDNMHGGAARIACTRRQEAA